MQTAMQGCWRQTPAMRSNLQEVRTLLDTARSAYIYALTPSPMRGAARRSNASSSSDSPRLDIDESMYDPPSDAYNTNLHRYVQLADLPRTPRVHTNAARSGEPDFDNPLDSPPLTPTLWPEQRLAPLGIVTFVFTDVQGSSVVCNHPSFVFLIFYCSSFIIIYLHNYVLSCFPSSSLSFLLLSLFIY